MRAFRVNVRAPPAPVIRPKSTELMFTFGSFHSGVLSRLIASIRSVKSMFSRIWTDLDSAASTPRLPGPCSQAGPRLPVVPGFGFRRMAFPEPSTI